MIKLKGYFNRLFQKAIKFFKFFFQEPSLPEIKKDETTGKKRKKPVRKK